VEPAAPARWSAGRKAFDLLVFVVLPIWGLYLNASLLHECTEPCVQYRLLSQPDVFGLYLLYGLTVAAYAVSRWRPSQLPPRREVAVFGGMMCGVLVSGALVVHFGFLPFEAGGGVLYSLVTRERYGPNLGALILVAPLFAPHLTCLMQLWEIRNRARRRRLEGAAAFAWSGALWSPAAIALYAFLMAVWRHSLGAAIHAFTQTCGDGTFGALVPPVCQDEHYLCTIAAQGHPWLVRPQRWGRRHGRPILVNRQLAIANAFEDLLQERWPRFGRWVRRTYDRLGLPISRYLRWRWMADICYVAMKPAEWGFLLTLLLLDRTAPEERIARMYRG